MDLGNSTVKTPEAETETPTPTRIQPVNPSPFSNGVLKRHAPLNLHHHPVVVTYKECLKNHAASIGGHAVDGCGEFMPSPASNPAEPTSLKCAACGCHRNFHRREPEDQPSPPPPNAIPALEYQPHRRHHPPPPPRENSGSSPNNSPSPPPISSSYYPSAPHMLLALSHGLTGPPPENNNNTPISISAAMNATTSTPMLSSGSRKRFRTKFTQYQKEKMLEFSGKVGWKMQKRDDDVINEFCNEIGVERGVFKVWMHNNKNTFGNKKDNPPPETTANGNGVAYSHHQHGGDTTDVKQSVHVQEMNQLHHRLHESTTAQALGTNGSSSSS
ncbi:Zinc-finger homeodomain protein 9 [Castilleja foliolosa]|uniref:Zinc-finger homeodomain protein 9 n=1 Tax=Castilleja foliolosa TaxID=1961234 RepID=A0ABD3C2N0_9LAMI